MLTEKFLKTQETKELNEMVIDYIKKTTFSPFKDIRINDEGDKVDIEFDSEFEKELNEKFGNPEEVLSDYITGLIEQSLEELQNKENSEEV